MTIFSIVRLLALLFFTSNLLLVVSATQGTCKYRNKGVILQEWQKQDLSKGQISLGKTYDNNFSSDQDGRVTAQVILRGNKISVYTDLDPTGRLRLLVVTTVSGQVANIYIGDRDSCDGSLDGSGITGGSNTIASVVLQTLQGHHA